LSIYVGAELLHSSSANQHKRVRIKDSLGTWITNRPI